MLCLILCCSSFNVFCLFFLYGSKLPKRKDCVSAISFSAQRFYSIYDHTPSKYVLADSQVDLLCLPLFVFSSPCVPELSCSRLCVWMGWWGGKREEVHQWRTTELALGVNKRWCQSCLPSFSCGQVTYSLSELHLLLLPVRNGSYESLIGREDARRHQAKCLTLIHELSFISLFLMYQVIGSISLTTKMTTEWSCPDL